MNWLTGKKTYIAAGALVVLGVVLVALKQTAMGLQMICVGAGFVGLGDKANRHQAEVLAAIQDAGRIVVDVKAGKPLTADFAAAVGEGVALGSAFATGGVITAADGVIGPLVRETILPTATVDALKAAMPSAADLDQVAKDEAAKAATSAVAETGNATLLAGGPR
jgi:hypothetical protein